jgi:hypothetical protein
MNRFRRFALMFGVVLTGCAPQAADHAPRPLAEVVAFELELGWQVSGPPAMPGPYRRLGLPVQVPAGRGGVATATVAGPQGKYLASVAAVEGAEQLIVPLEGPGGVVCHAVLSRPTRR